MHGAFTIPCGTLGLKEKDQSCHHEVWVHLSHVNARAEERVPPYNQAQRLLLKEIRPVTTAQKEGLLKEKATIRSCERSSI